MCSERGKKDWREGNGRPKGSGTALEEVQQWQRNNPNGKKADCIRETKLSKPTVLKWWKKAKTENLKLYANREKMEKKMEKLIVKQM